MLGKFVLAALLAMASMPLVVGGCGGDGATAVVPEEDSAPPPDTGVLDSGPADSPAPPIDAADAAPMGTGTLVLTLTDAPPNAAILVTGPGGYTSAPISATTTLANLAPGSYAISAPNRVSVGRAYVATVTGSPIAVANGTTVNASVSYTSSNTPPTITAIANQTVDADAATGALAFTINDAEEPLSALTVSGAVTFTPGLASSFTFGGAGGSRNVVLTPGSTAGVRQITITVTDGAGEKATSVFYLTVNAIGGAPNPIVINNNETGAGSLKDVMTAAPAGAVITFDPALHGQTITFTSELYTTKNVSIVSPDPSLIAISGNNATKHFTFFSNPAPLVVNLVGLTLKDGRGTDGSLYFGGPNTTANVSRCVFMNNFAMATAAIVSSNTAKLTVTDSTFSGNGIFNPAIPGDGNLIFLNTAGEFRNNTFVNNAVPKTVNVSGEKVVDITNCTFLPGPTTDAVFLNHHALATVRVSHSTFLGDPALNSKGIERVVPQGSVQLRNTIIGMNGANRNVVGGVTSVGYNLLDADATGLVSVGTDQVAALGLDPAAAYGGVTQTCRVQLASSALDKIPAASCVDAAGVALTTDQRGRARPAGAACDIGAFERQSND